MTEEDRKLIREVRRIKNLLWVEMPDGSEVLISNAVDHHAFRGFYADGLFIHLEDIAAQIAEGHKVIAVFEKNP